MHGVLAGPGPQIYFRYLILMGVGFVIIIIIKYLHAFQSVIKSMASSGTQ